MSSKNRYFLVARNRKDNKFKFLKMDDNFCEINHFPKDRKANELEIIDLYTSFFKNREEFINYLMLTSQIDSFDTDVFITYQSHKKDHMHFYEVIYNPYNNLRMQDFKTLARKSYEVGLNVHQRESENIINKFCSKMASDKSFRDVVLLDMTNVYKKFVEYFKEFTFSDRPVYSIKYREGGWALESYSLIRNIIEILNRCEMLGEKDKHLVDANIDFLNENINGRLNNSEMLIHKTDKNFFEGQISMFDYLEDKAASLEKEIFEDKEVEEVKEFPQMEPKKINFEKIMIEEKELSLEEKLLEVLNVIQKLNWDVFIYIDKKISFNSKIFNEYEDMDDLKKLQKLMRVSLMKNISLYTLHKHHLHIASLRGASTYSEEEEVRHFHKAIVKCLKDNEKALNDAYSWCRVYNRCIDYNKGDVNGKVYTKLKEDESN